MSLEDLSHDELQQLAELGAQATPSYQLLFKLYLKDLKKTRVTIKAMYLLRDALKIIGCPRIRFEPADIGYFFTGTTNPTAGGTGHTIRMCELRNVQVYIQDEWMK